MRRIGVFPMVCAAAAACAASAAPAIASAADVPCGLVQTGVIVVDGLADDWRGVPALNLHAGDPRDASAAIRCNYDDETLYLYVAVGDERLIRSKKPAAGDDRAVLSFGGTKLEVWPADTDKGIKTVTRWAGGGLPAWMTVVDSLQPKGWALELGLPLARVPGGGKGVPIVPFRFELFDADLASEGKVQDVVTTSDTTIQFDEARQMFEAFLTEHKLEPSNLRVDTLADVDGEPGLERVVSGGKVIAVIGREYSYIALPVQKSKDVLEVRVVDLAGEGRSSLLARYVERGNGGSREVLAIWNLNADASFNRTFAHEIAKVLGQNRLTNNWELVPKTAGKKGKKGAPGKGFDLVITVGEAVGFTQETWAELPAEDMQPILLPWDGPKREVWRFRGDEFYGGPE